MSMVNNSKFDERQILARGKGFQIGFFLAIGLAFLNSLFEADLFPIGISVYSRLMIFIWTCITVVSVFFIAKDAYDGINKTGGKALMIIFIVCGTFVLITLIWRLASGERTFVENGVVGDSLGQIFYAVSMLIIGCVYLVRNAANKKAFGSDEK